MRHAAWILAAVAACWCTPAEAARVLPPLVKPGVGPSAHGILGIDINGPFQAHAFRTFKPGSFVVDLDQAALDGRALELDGIPGTPVRGVRVFQYKDHTVRAFLQVAEPRRLKCRIVQLGPERARLEIYLPEPIRKAPRAIAKHGPSDLAAAAGTTITETVADAAVARLPNPLEAVEIPRAWQRTPALARALTRPAAPARVAEQALQQLRLGGANPLWQWRSSTQALYTSNVGQFQRGAPAWGTRHRMMGFFYEPTPLLRGAMVAHVDHQAMRFTDPRYDYASLLGSFALTHPLVPHLHFFEGGAMLDRQPINATDLAVLDTSLYAGFGVFGNLSPTSAWSATATAERVAASSVRDSYYGQALKLRYLGQLGGLASLSGQATLQRIDPVVRTTPFVRGYLEGSLERLVVAGVRAGVQTQLGLEQGVQGRQTFFVAGPYMQVAF